MSEFARAELTATKHSLVIGVSRELLADCPPLDMEAVMSARTRVTAEELHRLLPGKARRRVRQYRQLAGWLAYRILAGHWPEDYYGNEEEP